MSQENWKRSEGCTGCSGKLQGLRERHRCKEMTGRVNKLSGENVLGVLVGCRNWVRCLVICTGFHGGYIWTGDGTGCSRRVRVPGEGPGNVLGGMHGWFGRAGMERCVGGN